ncbi:MAG: TolC family protein [Campylobacterales bacterium]|nr:TolC family protein [Campylobacterales bacterium]
MKKLALILIPYILFSKSVDFHTALSLTLKNSQELKGKKLDLKSSKKQIEEANSYNFGTLSFNETVSHTNHAGYVFGMKMSAREATFGDFGFKDFLTPLGSAIYGASQGQAPSDMSSLLKKQPDDLNNPEARTNYETKLSYDIPLFVGFKLQSGKEMATLQAMAKEAKLNHDEKALGLKVLQGYNGAVTAKKFIQLTKKGKARANSFIKTASDMYRKKLTRIVDVKQAKMAYLSIDTKLQEAQNNYNMAIAYLKFLTGDNSITDVADMKEISYSSKSLPELQQIAIESRDDFSWMNYNVQTMKKKVTFDSSDRYPTIGAHLEYGYNDDSFSVDSEHDYYLVAVGLKYNIFDGGLVSAKKEKAQLDYLKTKNYFELMENGIKLEVEKNFNDFTTQEETFEAKKNTGAMSEEILDETVKIYKNNLNFRTNMMYLLMSLQSMMTAQGDVIKSEYDKSLAGAKLQLSLGKSLQ